MARNPSPPGDNIRRARAPRRQRTPWWLAAVLLAVLVLAAGDLSAKASSLTPSAAPAAETADDWQNYLQQFLHWLGLVSAFIGGMGVTLLFCRWQQKRSDSVRLANAQGARRKQNAPPENSRDRFGALFENANDLIQGIALDGKLLYANQAWHEVLDYSAFEMKSLTIYDVLSPECVDNFRVSFGRAAVGVKIRSIETTFVSKYGKKVVVEGSLHAELVDDRPVAIQAIFRDMTERKRSEAALKQSEERFSRVFAASPVAIAIFTLDGGRMVDVNDSFLSMLGYVSGEIFGRTDLKLGIWSDEADRERILQRVGGGKSVRDEQCKLRSKTGEVRQALISAEAVEVNNERCALLMIYDNTERLNLEAQLRQAQKMEGIGQLAAGIAHDFNNILTVIQGHVARFKQIISGPPSIRDSVDQVLVAADRAAVLTRQLLTFCRKQAMVAKIIDVNDTVKHVIAMLERILGEDIALEVNPGTAVPQISADSAMLEMVLMNLACNSRDAMPKGGRLTISTSVVNITAAYAQQQAKARPGVHACLTVSDTGSGMSPETLRRIFEPFFTTKDVGKGTGLGLATVYGIIDQHRGWVEVTSEVGKGTTFKIYLPASTRQRPRTDAPPAPAAPSVPAADAIATTTTSAIAIETSAPAAPVVAIADTGSRKETILLVEDEDALRELAKVVLEDCGYRILEASSGVQALKVWEENKSEIAMLLTDMVMPEGLSGRELAERLQGEKAGLKVLYSSGYSPDVVGGYFKLPENSYFLAKPYLPPQLTVAVRECLDGIKRPPESLCEEPEAV